MANPFNTARIPCDVEGCPTDFARQADMQRHVKEHHGGLLICTVPNCPWRGAKRKSRLEAHLQNQHGAGHKSESILNNVRAASNACQKLTSLFLILLEHLLQWYLHTCLRRAHSQESQSQVSI